MIIIVLWMIAFAVVHSLTADKRFKNWIARQFGQRFYDGWYRLIYNVLAVVMLAPLFLYMWAISEPLYRINGWVAWLFVAIQAIGVIGLVISLLQIDWLRFGGVKQALVYLQGGELPLANEPLQTEGIYGWVRHPLYFFSLLAIWFSPVMTTSALLFNIAATVYFIIGSRIEEQRMIDAFGDAYRDYQQRVPWLIPMPPSR